MLSNLEMSSFSLVQYNLRKLGGIILRGNLEYVDRPRRVDGNKEPHTEPQRWLLAE
jgi:hypothetical protein